MIPNSQQHTVRKTPLTEAEIRRYYKKVLKLELPDSQDLVTLPCCPFLPHTGGFTVNLRTGYWRCLRGCGGGDIIEFEMRRSERDHIQRSRERVFEIIASAQEAAASVHNGASPIPLAQVSPIVASDADQLLAKIRLHPRASRRYLQQTSHWPRDRFRRALESLEREGRVSWDDERTTGGRRRRVYFVPEPREPAMVRI
jgi:hypothetical protein